MKEIEVEIEGTSPLLMHSAQNMGKQEMKKNPAKQYDSKKDAESVAYRNKKGELVVPARCIKACFVNASSWYKVGKQGMKPLLAGLTRIEPYDVNITNGSGKVVKNYEIDIRPVVVQRARIMRSRPCFKQWTLKFKIVYNAEVFSTPEFLKNMKSILEEAGQRIGLLDNRPQKYGENGTFRVNKFRPN